MDSAILRRDYCWLQYSTAQSNLAPIPLSRLLRSHSRKQESDADNIGLDLLCVHYGLSTGIQVFFTRHVNEEDLWALLSITRSHPLSQQRLDDLTRWSMQRNCGAGKTNPWNH